MTTDDVAVLELVNAVLRGDVPPAPAPSEYDFAKTIRLPAGRRRGRFYDPDSDACQRHLLLVISSRRFRRVVVCAPPQVGGKTTSAILPATLRAITAARELVGYGLPTLEALDKAWTEKLKPSIEGSGYGEHLPAKGAGSKGGRGPVIHFRDPITGDREGGIVFMAGGAYGSTASLIIVDDVDQFRIKGKPDREAVEDILHRADSYGDDSLRIVVGTIEFDEGSVVLALLEDSTGTHPWPACPHCGVHQVLTWDHVVVDLTTDATAHASARYRCDHCAALWTEDDRQRAIDHRRVLFCDRGQRVEAGVVVGEPSPSRTFGIVWPALAASQADLRELCVEFRAAKLAVARADHSLMRKFYRYRLCLPYTGDRDDENGDRVRIDRQHLERRSAASSYAIVVHDKEDQRWSRYWSEIPRNVEWITAAVDVQQDRLYWSAIGWDAAGRTYRIAHGYECACELKRMASVPELHAALDRVHGLVAQGPPGGGWPVPVVARGIDIGYRPDEIDAWRRTHPDWLMVKGAGDEQSHAMDRSDPGERHAGGRLDIPGCVSLRRSRAGRLVHHIDVDGMREVAQAGFLVPIGQPGAAHLPRGLAAGDAFIKHLCARALVIDPKTRRRKWSADPRDGGQLRKDWLDTDTYQMALGRMYQSRMLSAAAAERAAITSAPTRAERDWVDADDSFNDVQGWE
jgi:phage terminase large subunit GpA-like protein